MKLDSSCFVTMEHRILQTNVDDPKILALKVLSPKQILLSAKGPGETLVTIWGEDNKDYTIAVLVRLPPVGYTDSTDLEKLLRAQFPAAVLKVTSLPQGALLITGFVDRPEDVNLITRIAEQFVPEERIPETYGQQGGQEGGQQGDQRQSGQSMSMSFSEKTTQRERSAKQIRTKVINAVSVSGVQQVLLHVKVMEISRTKLRSLGFDFAKVTGSNVVLSGISGLLTGPVGGSLAGTGSPTFSFGVVNGTSAFFGVLEALRQDNLMKVMAEPTLVTISGRPAYVNVGGEFPVPVPQSLGTISIEYKKYGTQLDFVPIVMNNARIRLEVRPRVTEIDKSRSYVMNGTEVPALRSREAETGVEMQAGQTLAIAGLVQYRAEATNRGLPWLSELPILGALFRKVSEETNEVELLIMVTPELVDAMDPRDVPPCGPGMMTKSPSDWELFMQGHPEVPNCCPSCDGAGCAECSNGAGPNGREVPPDGMIGPSEPILAPQPSDTSWRRPPLASFGSARVATAPARGVSSGRYEGSAAPQNPYNPSSPKLSLSAPQPGVAPGSEPSFIGPMGYDAPR